MIFCVVMIKKLRDSLCSRACGEASLLFRRWQERHLVQPCGGCGVPWQFPPSITNRPSNVHRYIFRVLNASMTRLTRPAFSVSRTRNQAGSPGQQQGPRKEMKVRVEQPSLAITRTQVQKSSAGAPWPRRNRKIKVGEGLGWSISIPRGEYRELGQHMNKNRGLRSQQKVLGTHPGPAAFQFSDPE